ncbi:phosphate regulon transcriptional regulator PhoB [Sinimarinibacterium sp. NLF-5-8]|uniref:phosphate regulon transcriptional regulator PhoB n=1 Tax=Sinimarinibacterium sp. NLF-5-8 TaxID=2698684 RepID=UPI00137BBA6C|nr:phosphate regulon transcriptional regulator PhoB [Sinimarinibacterium sp. NLF-5-8]QHS11234.1 phosphate regulon transcriptional regulatory protein PhoB [Sinimarinibacterium sp. NLF-5-8]
MTIKNTDLLPERRVLIVEDDPAIRSLLRMALTRAGFVADEAADAACARVRMAEARPDLILMDWMMPGTSGVELARELKAQHTTRDIPIIMLTARAQEDDKVHGLNVGCDDYVAKPFSHPELIARIHAVLRRSTPGGTEQRIGIGRLVVDLAAQRVSVDGEPVKLGPSEYRLLQFFVSHPDRVYTREQVLDRVWGQGVYIEERTVDVHIRRLRKALEPHGCEAMLQTVRGSGYRFSDQP